MGTAGSAAIVAELQASFALAAQPRTVAYGGSSGAFPITGLFISPGNGVSLPLVTTTAPFGGGNGGATSGTLTTGSASSFNVTYNHAPAAGAGACGANVDSFRVVGTGGGGTTPTRLVNITVSNPTLTPGGISPTIAYSTSTQTVTLTVSPATVAQSTNLTIGAVSEGTAVATGPLSFTYAASATPVSAAPTVQFTINTTSCGSIAGTATINITPQIISAAAASGTQGAAFNYQIRSIPAATAYSMSGADVATLTAVGLSFSAVTGQISGMPTVAGPAFNVTVNATTSGGPVSRVLAITILSSGASAISGPNTATGGTITGPNAVTGTVGTALNIAYTASNPVILSVGSSGLPAGLSFGITSAAAGAVAVTGTPTQSQSTANNNVFNVLLNATNGSGLGANTPLTLTINPAVVAAMTNASLTPLQNTAFNYNFLTTNVSNIATSAKITFSATGLPAGLTINPNTGVISGSATSSGGPTVATVTATNAAGAPSASVTFNVTPTLVPGITSPTAISGTIGTPITPLQIVASNLPITAYTGTGLPPGITVNATTGIISGTPTTSGSGSATLTATNGAGMGSAIVPFTIAALPVGAGPGTMTVPLNTATTIDLATFITGSGITGAQIASNPAHGQVSINGTRATYTPANNYFGTDSFSYTAFGTSGTSAAAFITVTIIGRPDPTADATVLATINNQVETARRFSQSQLSNYQRRMESLHRGGTPTGESTNPSAQANAGSAPAALNSAAALPRPFPDLTSANPLGEPQNNARLTPPVRVAGLTPPTDAVNPATGSFGAMVPGLMTSLMTAATSRSINLAAVGGGSYTPGAFESSTSFWLGGDARFGSRDSNGAMGGTNFSTDGVSAGVDRRFSDKLVLGVGLGFARDKASIGTDGSQSQATGTSAAFYGSYQPTPTTFVDALLGYGTLSLDAQRFVAPMSSIAYSHRSGDQVFGSVAAGYEYRDKGLLLSPYGRFDFSVNRLKQTSETGVGAFSLTYFDQTDRTLRSALGLRAEASHATDWGVAKPRIRFEYQHGFQGGGSARLAYSDLIGGPNYTVTPSTTDRNAILLGVGSSLVMRNGLTFGIDYQIMRSFAQETSQAVRFTVSKELDGKGSSASLLPDFDESRPALGIRVDAGYMYDRNVSRGRDSAEKLSDQSYSVELSKGWIFPVTEHTRAVVALSGGGEKFHSYEGLSRLFSGVLGEFQYRTSGDFSAPTFGVFARATGEQFESYLRDGYRYAIGVSARKPVTDRITVFGAVTHNERTTQSAVFTGRDNSVRLNVDYAATPTSTLYMTGEYRRGDTVSSGLPSLASVNIAKVLARDDAFNDALFAYRLEARTVVATVGYNLPFGPRDSLDFSYRRVQSTSVENPSPYGRSRYNTDQLSLSYLLRF